MQVRDWILLEHSLLCQPSLHFTEFELKVAACFVFSSQRLNVGCFFFFLFTKSKFQAKDVKHVYMPPLEAVNLNLHGVFLVVPAHEPTWIEKIVVQVNWTVCSSEASFLKLEITSHPVQMLCVDQAFAGMEEANIISAMWGAFGLVSGSRYF